MLKIRRQKKILHKDYTCCRMGDLLFGYRTHLILKFGKQFQWRATETSVREESSLNNLSKSLLL